MFEVDDPTGALGVLLEVLVDGVEVVGVAEAIGIDVGDDSLGAGDGVETGDCLVHAELACEADASVLGGHLRLVEDVEGEGIVLVGALPCLGLRKGLLVLLVDGGWIFGGGVDDEEKLDVLWWSLALPEGVERCKCVGFVVAWDDDDDPRVRHRWLLDLGGRDGKAFEVRIWCGHGHCGVGWGVCGGLCVGTREPSVVRRKARYDEVAYGSGSREQSDVAGGGYRAFR